MIFLETNCFNSISTLIDWSVYYTSPKVDLGPSVEAKCWDWESNDWEKLLMKNASWCQIDLISEAVMMMMMQL